MNKTISFVLCSRNDNYMGNPVGRLEMALNYLAENVQSLGRQESVEVIVTDWGSKVPLKEVLNLNATAAKITRFLEVPVAVVKEVQKDSPFAEVLALNAAARRASGQFIGRIDQDTLVGKRFLKIFFEWVDGIRNLGADIKTSYLFSKRRQIPFDVTMRVTRLDNIKTFLKLCARRLLVEEWPPFFFNSPVGIMILSRDLWMECGGYDERLLYWGWMEVDLAHRLEEEHSVVDIGPQIRHDFYHLEHYDPRLPRETPRKMNPRGTENLEFHPNDQDWGLIKYPLPVSAYIGHAGSKPLDAARVPIVRREWPVVCMGVLTVMIQSCWRDVNAAYKKLFVRAFRALMQPERYPSYFKRMVNFVLGSRP
jgi:hypothetical protein